MRKSVVAVYNGSDYVPAIPYIYDENEWKRVNPKVYITGWKDAGGAGELFYYFLEHNEEYYNSTQNILVRQQNNRDNWITSDGEIFNITDNAVNRSGIRLQFKLIPRELTHMLLKDSNTANLKDSNDLELMIRR